MRTMPGADVTGQEAILARAVSDASDCLVQAEEPLAGLQRSCGGELPGMIAVPELLELVRKAQRHRLPLAGAITALDGLDLVTTWVEVAPHDLIDGEQQGCDITLRSWQAEPLPSDDARSVLQRRALIDREVAELCAWLDADQRILAVTSDSVELRGLASTMQEGIGRPVTDFLTATGSAGQALHWRMLDGAPVTVEGSSRDWRMELFPLTKAGAEPSGFELLLVSDQPPPAPLPRSGAPVRTALPAGRGVVGPDLAPVLRQPIARIVANAETIRSRLAGPLPDAYADYAAEIANAGRLLLGLLEDLADLEVVEADEFATTPDAIDLAEVARQAAGILSVRAREKQILVDAPHVGERLPARAEFRRVLQVLINLVGNAIRYSPQGSRIAIELERSEDRARVSVVDQGPGLSSEDQRIVFEKFERLGRTGDGGSGLGLYISRRLARAMGGELTVESVTGQGARFTLDVPADFDADPG
jgi:anti-sigma regulatory factor (Ser/Thr protein kinase)